MHFHQLHQLSWLALLFSLVSHLTPVVVAQTSPQDLYQSLVDWIVEKGGYVNPKVEYRRVNPDDASSRYGMFALEDIQAGETLSTVPWSCILTAGTDRSGGLQCDTIRLLVEEMQKSSESDYAPYIQYLKSLPTGVVPSAWSKEGKNALELISGYDGQLPPDEPVLWLEKHFRLKCKGNLDSSEETQAAMLVLSKGDDGLMVPLHDLYQHRNGRHMNADTTLTPGIKHEVMAIRPITKGDEIHISFNQCKDCQDCKWYGTPAILRDYGIVEELPQSYYFFWLGFGFHVDEKVNDADTLQVTWTDGKLLNENVAYLQSQLVRLNQVVRPELEQLQQEESIPVHEWNVLSKYYDSLMVALQAAIQAAGGVDPNVFVGETIGEGKCVVHDGYDDLERVDVGFHNYQSYCDNHDIVDMSKRDSMRLIDRNVNDEVQSPFQLLTFMDRQEAGVQDKCLELDDMLQICTSFRPHYHDYVTHFPARYKEHVKRVVFVGGGDCMVLHEMLKYPNIELIVGLELDQTVVRESMKQFRTQPHFDDERVQWWFGDATTSLLMLPREYFGSFDMVVVDLSESIMSFSVIKHVDIMEALALLLKPDGIMIKNDMHFQNMSDIFDYTIQFSVTDVPIICEQAFVIGSNAVDFLRPDVDVLVKGHGVDMPLLEPVKDLNDSFKLIQKYRKSDARDQGKCDNLVSDSDVELKRAGLFMVVEAENAKGPLKGDKLTKALLSALEKEGLELISTVSNESQTKGDHVVFVMKEGVIVARTWPKEMYCAFDIHLWGRFNKMESVRNSLTDAVGSKKGSVSSFRIVVGGMRGTDTWKQDKQEIGPKIVQHRDCEEHTGTGIINESAINTVIKESLKLIPDDVDDPLVAVICGSEKEPCSSLDVVQKSDKVKNAIPLWTCPDIVNVEFMGDAALRMSKCELKTLKTLRDAVAKHGTAFSALALDTRAPVAMARIVRNMLANPRHQNELLMSRIMFVAPMKLNEKEMWRRSFLDRSRRNLKHESVFRVEMTLVGSGNEQVEVGILSTGNTNFLPRLVEFADSVQSRTGVRTEIKDVIGAPPLDFAVYQPKLFTANDYDVKPGQAQFTKQQPLGHHIVSQLKITKPTFDSDSFASQLSGSLTSSLAQVSSSFNKDIQVFGDGIGDGLVAVAVAPEGTGIAVWDGNQCISLNLFLFDSDTAAAGFDNFVKEFSSLDIKAMSKDEQPRGIGKVVNFARDL